MGRNVKEVGRGPASQTISYFRIKKGVGYHHYLYCPFVGGKMVCIKGQTGEKISSDIFETAVKQFQKMLERKERD